MYRYNGLTLSELPSDIRRSLSYGFGFGQQVRIDYNAGSYTLADTWDHVDNQANLYEGDSREAFYAGVYEGFNKWFTSKIDRT